MRKLLVASAARPPARLRPLNDPRQIHALSDMGISVLTLPDGRVQLLYTTNTKSKENSASLCAGNVPTFAQKVRNIQAAGARLAIILDNVPDSTHESTTMFAMSSDGRDDIVIPAVFLFTKDGAELESRLKQDADLRVTVGQLTSMRNVLNGETTDTDAEPELTTVAHVEKDSFEHLIKVLNQLVAQFELSLTDGTAVSWPENSQTLTKTEKTDVCPVHRELAPVNIASTDSYKVTKPNELKKDEV